MGIGEGVVWHYITDNFEILNFKVKGEKHSVSNDLSLQEGRLVQSIQKLEESGKKIDQSSTGDFLRWIIGDVMKEEEDTIIKNGWDPKKLNPLISKVAREWYFKQLVS